MDEIRFGLVEDDQYRCIFGNCDVCEPGYN